MVQMGAARDVGNESGTPMLLMRQRRLQSNESLRRYSENTLHSSYLGRYGASGEFCVFVKISVNLLYPDFLKLGRLGSKF